MNSEAVDPVRGFLDLFSGIDLAKPSKSKYDGAEADVAQLVGLDPKQVTVKWISERKMTNNRISEFVTQAPQQLVVLLCGDDTTVEKSIELAREKLRTTTCVVCIPPQNGGTEIAAVIGREGETVTERCRDLFKHATFVASAEPVAQPRGAATTKSVATIPLILDPRVRRMLRLSVASTTAILLVGPPGTGKTMLLKELIDDVRQSPSDFGFDHTPNEALWVTPEESWTTRELVGGETVDEEQRLRFRPGFVLEALRQNRWLVLDEANRADMDKIFGGLLTWLTSEDDVELGRASTGVAAAAVTIGWSGAQACAVLGAERLASTDVGVEPIRFLAGSAWRLLGTYNAQDAHRVFRFGQALGRRFVRIPVPPLTVAEFDTALRGKGDDVPPEVLDSIVGIYAAHFAESSSQLGPAIFFNTREYVRAGLDRTVLCEFEDGTSEVERLGQLLAEAYLTIAGTWLARLEQDELDRLGARLVKAGGLPASEWQWLVTMLPALT